MDSPGRRAAHSAPERHPAPDHGRHRGRRSSVTDAKIPTRPPDPSRVRVPQRPGDRIFSGTARGAGILILLILAGVALFLVIEAIPAITASPEDLPDGESLASYIGPLIFGTLLAAVIALVVATPLAVGIALFITHFAPRRLA